MAILRSPHPHAKIKKIDVSRARALRGVWDISTGAEIAELIGPVPSGSRRRFSITRSRSTGCASSASRSRSWWRTAAIAGGRLRPDGRTAMAVPLGSALGLPVAGSISISFRPDPETAQAHPDAAVRRGDDVGVDGVEVVAGLAGQHHALVAPAEGRIGPVQGRGGLQGDDRAVLPEGRERVIEMVAAVDQADVTGPRRRACRAPPSAPRSGRAGMTTRRPRSR